MSDEVLSAERIAYQATTHECGWAEHHINALVESKVAEALTQAQESLAAARAQAQKLAAKWRESAIDWRDDGNGIQAAYYEEFADELEAAITPSESTALAKLLAEERLKCESWDILQRLVEQVEGMIDKLPDGEYKGLGGLRIKIREGRAVLAARNEGRVK